MEPDLLKKAESLRNVLRRLSFELLKTIASHDIKGARLVVTKKGICQGVVFHSGFGGPLVIDLMHDVVRDIRYGEVLEEDLIGRLAWALTDEDDNGNLFLLASQCLALAPACKAEIERRDRNTLIENTFNNTGQQLELDLSQ